LRPRWKQDGTNSGGQGEKLGSAIPSTEDDEVEKDSVSGGKQSTLSEVNRECAEIPKKTLPCSAEVLKPSATQTATHQKQSRPSDETWDFDRMYSGKRERSSARNSSGEIDYTEHQGEHNNHKPHKEKSADEEDKDSKKYQKPDSHGVGLPDRTRHSIDGPSSWMDRRKDC